MKGGTKEQTVCWALSTKWLQCTPSQGLACLQKGESEIRAGRQGLFDWRRVQSQHSVPALR